MKIPESLPWKITPTFDLAIVSDKISDEAICIDLHEKDALYIVEACNSYPLMIELLKKSVEDLGIVSKIKLNCRIKQFLKTLEYD